MILIDWDMDINIPKIFTGRVVTILAGGPSLEGFNFACVESPVIAVNNAALFAKSNMLVSLDKDWHMKNNRFLDSYEGFLVTDRETHRKEAHVITYTGRAYKPDSLDWHMKNINLSGYVALAVALHLGASKVFLLGFDGGFNGEASNYYPNSKNVNDHTYSNNNDHFNLFRGDIVNVGLDSRIDAFRKVPLNEHFYAA